jgi:hypothetical protein
VYKLEAATTAGRKDEAITACEALAVRTASAKITLNAIGATCEAITRWELLAYETLKKLRN